MTAAGESLKGLSVLVTRPERQSANLCREVEQRAGSALCLPLLEIQRAEMNGSLSNLLGQVDQFDMVIFVSPNAARHGIELLESIGKTLAYHTVVAAVGKTTALCLNGLGVEQVVFPPADSNSEELLKCPVMQRVAGKRIVIFRGQDGRELLGDSLMSRGAVLDYAAVYRRVHGRVDQGLLSEWMHSERPVLILTSADAMKSLIEQITDEDLQLVFSIPVVVLSVRLKEVCRAAGWRARIAVSKSAEDASLTNTVAELY